MLKPQEWKTLTLPSPLQPGRPSFISAASGLVEAHGDFYVIADDENFLFRFSNDDKSEVLSYQLSEKALSLKPKERKKQKSDFEALSFLPSENSLLIVPSGSKPQRQSGFFIETGESGPKLPPQSLDFSKFYESLPIPNLNIEAALPMGDRFVFLNRGNSTDAFNALISVDLNDLLVQLKSGSFTESLPARIVKIELGLLQNQPLSFTDAYPLNSYEFIFLAAAENTDNTYDDGEYLGATLGVMNLKGEILFQEPLEIPDKPEGICIYKNHIWMATDADNPEKPSKLYRMLLPKFGAV